MFKVSQKVVFTKESVFSGIEGAIVTVDDNDPVLPYYIAFEDEDGEEDAGWFTVEDVEAVREEEGK